MNRVLIEVQKQYKECITMLIKIKKQVKKTKNTKKQKIHHNFLINFNIILKTSYF